MIAFAISQLAGLARRILVASVFGTAIELDAFIAANRVSETIFNIIAGGALGSAFIPTFTALLEKKQREAAWRLASAVGNLVFLIMSLVGLAAFIFAPEIVRYALAPAFAAKPPIFELTVELLRIQLASAVLFGLSGLVMGILNAHQVFLIPALTPSIYQFGLIAGVFFFVPRMGIHGLAWGVVAGAAGHLLLQLPTLLKTRAKYAFTLGLGDAQVREVIRLMGPRLFGVAVVQLNFWVNTRLATQMSTGSVVGVDYGFALMLMAQVAIAQSIATAMMPTLAAQYALGKMEDLRRALAASLRGVLLLSIPASVGLILLRFPLISLLYQRGEFNQRSVELVAWALLWYAAGLVGHALVEILARAFYALHDTRTPVSVGAAAMGLNIILSISLAAVFESIGWMPHGGLALANTVATGLEAIVLIVLINRRLEGIHAGYILRGTLQFSLAAAAMGLALVTWMQFRPTDSVMVTGLVGVVIGGITYGLAILLLRIPEVQLLLAEIRQRLT